MSAVFNFTFVPWFRSVAPYIHKFRNQTFVVGVCGEAIDAGYLRFVQPDVGKWGGVSGGLAVARNAARHGIAYCPHWLGGGVGLAASLHVLAGSGSTDGWAEVDANPNPLREGVCALALEDGWVTLPDAPGLGALPELDTLAPYRVAVDTST